MRNHCREQAQLLISWRQLKDQLHRRCSFPLCNILLHKRSPRYSADYITKFAKHFQKVKTGSILVKTGYFFIVITTSPPVKKRPGDFSPKTLFSLAPTLLRRQYLFLEETRLAFLLMPEIPSGPRALIRSALLVSFQNLFRQVLTVYNDLIGILVEPSVCHSVVAISSGIGSPTVLNSLQRLGCPFSSMFTPWNTIAWVIRLWP